MDNEKTSNSCTKCICAKCTKDNCKEEGCILCLTWGKFIPTPGCINYESEE